ncbi:MAG: hypothetical protein NZO58_06170 [Gemmataceae bacterium]|nr:hypothetical protein [Gemmataceae bacterium]
MERLTGQARRAIAAAFHEAQTRHDDHVGTEHLLLGLLNERHAGAGALLDLLSVDPQRLQQRIRLALPQQERAILPRRTALTPGMRRALQSAAQAADAAGHAMIGPEHLLIGLSREPGSLAQFLLAEAKIDSALLCRALQRLPPTENRDELVQPSPRVGSTARADPSRQELQQLFQEAMSTTAGAAEDWGAGWWSEEAAHLRRQLARTRLALSVFAGGVVGAGLDPWFLPLCLAAGAVVGVLRNAWVGGLAGGCAGMVLTRSGWGDQPLWSLLLVLGCVVAGLFVGDFPGTRPAGKGAVRSSDAWQA